MESRDVGWPEPSAGAKYLWLSIGGRRLLEKIRVLANWKHDLLYKNQGVLTREHSFTNLYNDLTATCGPGTWARDEVNREHRDELIEAGAPKWAAHMIYRANSTFIGKAVWDDAELFEQAQADRRRDTGR